MKAGRRVTHQHAFGQAGGRQPLRQKPIVETCIPGVATAQTVEQGDRPHGRRTEEATIGAHHGGLPTVLLEAIWITDCDGNDLCLELPVYLYGKGPDVVVLDGTDVAILDLLG